MNTKNLSIVAKLALFAATVIWGISFFIMKNSVDIFPPSFLLAVRFTIGCIVLILLFFPRLKHMTWDYWKVGAPIGLFIFAAYTLQTLGLTDPNTSPGKNAFLTAVYCVLVPFLAWGVTKKKPDIYNISAGVLCMAGIGFVSVTENFSMGWGDLLTLAGGLMYAAHMVAVAKFSKDKDPILITIVQFAYAAVFSWIVSLIFEPMPTAFPIHACVDLLYLAVFCTGVALLLQNFGQKYTEASSASIILSLEAVFGVVFSLIFYPDEKLTPRLAFGFFLIFAAVILSETKLSFLRKKKQ